MASPSFPISLFPKHLCVASRNRFPTSQIREQSLDNSQELLKLIISPFFHRNREHPQSYEMACDKVEDSPARVASIAVSDSSSKCEILDAASAPLYVLQPALNTIPAIVEAKRTGTKSPLKEATTDYLLTDLLPAAQRGVFGELVQTTANQIVQNNPLDRYDEICLHHVKRWLTKPTLSQPTVSCPICFDELDIVGLKPISNEAKPAIALFCSHMICEDCFGSYLERFRCGPYGHRKYPCPVCKTVNSYRMCLDKLPVIFIPTNDDVEYGVEDIGMVVQELGRVPDYCTYCENTTTGDAPGFGGNRPGIG